MVQTERYFIGLTEYVRTYSDCGRYVVRDGISYEEAYDIASFGRTYTEGEPIPYEEPTNEDYIAIGRIMMGVNPL